MIAYTADALRRHQLLALRQDAVVAQENLRALKTADEHVESVNASLRTVVSAVETTNEKLDEVITGVEKLGSAVADLGEVLREGFDIIAQEMCAQHQTLLDIAGTLRRPYTTKAAELRDEAKKWLTVGMNKSASDAKEDFADSLRLYREVVKNPIGNQDYVAWFDIGWLLWRYENDLAKAEEAFRRACRLSEPSGDLYHQLSLRHLAQIQYIEGRYEDAWQTIQKAIPAAVNHDAPFDAARYACKTGRTGDALMLIEKCIDLQPTTFVTMFAEVDFATLHAQMLELASRKTQQAKEQAQTAVNAAMLDAETIHSHRPSRFSDPPKSAATSLHKTNQAKVLFEKNEFISFVHAQRVATRAIAEAADAINSLRKLRSDKAKGTLICLWLFLVAVTVWAALAAFTEIGGWWALILGWVSGQTLYELLKDKYPKWVRLMKSAW